MDRSKKKRIFDIIQIGYAGDFLSKLFDALITVAILANIFIAIFDTFDASAAYADVLNLIETITVVGFTAEYALRLWTAEYLYPNLTRGKAKLRYIGSFNGVIDLLSFLPFYLPVMFPAGIVVFRMFRVVRILRLFRINVYYDALNVIGDVIRRKKDQILSSIFIILVLMVMSSLCMYGLEHEAQPDVFENAFSGFWWSVSTLLTVGYGDIYPITMPGKVFGIVITFLGVGMVAIPTGILSAGFVEQYTILKNSMDYLMEEELRFIRLKVNDETHPWAGKTVRELPLPARADPGSHPERRGDDHPPGGYRDRTGGQYCTGSGGRLRRYRDHAEGDCPERAAPVGGICDQRPGYFQADADRDDPAG